MAGILYIQTSGTDTPERLYAPFILGMTARAAGIDAAIFFMIRGVTVIKAGEAEQIRIGEFPDLRAVMDEALAGGVEIFACEQSTRLLGIARGDLIPEAKIAGAATLNDLALDADAVITF